MQAHPATAQPRGGARCPPLCAASGAICIAAWSSRRAQRAHAPWVVHEGSRAFSALATAGPECRARGREEQSCGSDRHRLHLASHPKSCMRQRPKRGRHPPAMRAAPTLFRVHILQISAILRVYLYLNQRCGVASPAVYVRVCGDSVYYIYVCVSINLKRIKRSKKPTCNYMRSRCEL